MEMFSVYVILFAHHFHLSFMRVFATDRKGKRIILYQAEFSTILNPNGKWANGL